jgi:uncharacterized protein
MDFLFLASIILGIILIIVAFIGCIVPALPGPPFAFLALLSLDFAQSIIFSSNFLWTMGIITLGVYLLDYLLPIFGAKMFSATKQGIWFSILGMLIGIFFFPPFGMILGLLLGAIFGELIAGKAKAEAVKIGIISFVFSLLAMFIKIALVSTIAFYFTKAVIQYYI